MGSGNSAKKGTAAKQENTKQEKEISVKNKPANTAKALCLFSLRQVPKESASLQKYNESQISASKFLMETKTGT